MRKARTLRKVRAAVLLEEKELFFLGSNSLKEENEMRKIFTIAVVIALVAAFTAARHG